MIWTFEKQSMFGEPIKWPLNIRQSKPALQVHFVDKSSRRSAIFPKMKK